MKHFKVLNSDKRFIYFKDKFENIEPYIDVLEHWWTKGYVIHSI